MAKRASTPTRDSGRVRCNICGERTRNIQQHTRTAHAGAEAEIQTREEPTDDPNDPDSPTHPNNDPAYLAHLAATEPTGPQDGNEVDAPLGVPVDLAALVDAMPVVVDASETPEARRERIADALTVPAEIVAPAVTERAPVPMPRGSLMDRAVCLAVNKGRFGNTKRASTVGVEVNADKAMLALSKRLLASPELVSVRRLDNEIWQYLNTVALPSMFKNGVYLVPIPMVQQIEDDLKAFADRRAVLVDAFIAAYPAQVVAIRESLRDLYNSLDYPSIDKMRGLFYFEWQYVTFGVPGTLKQINAALFKAETEKAATKVQEAADECRQIMRANLRDMVEHLAERLTVVPGEPKKVFREATIANFNEFLRTFEMKDITDDAELGELVHKARGVMSGVDVGGLRSDEALRDAIANQMVALKGSLDGMIVEKTRQITFEDEASA